MVFLQKILTALKRIFIQKTFYLLPKNVTVRGDIESVISGNIDGYVEGTIKTEGDLVINKNAVIKGDIHATDLIVHGRIYGNIFCSNKTIISNASYVRGNITAAILDIKEGATIEGVIKKNAEIISVTDKNALKTEQEASATDPNPENKGYKIRSSINTDTFPAKWF